MKTTETIIEDEREPSAGAVSPPGGRLIWGVTVLLMGNVAGPLMIPLIIASQLPTGWKATISGFLMLGGPELSIVAAVAILGQAGFAWVKSRLFAFLKREAPMARVSHSRYRAGLLLFGLILVLSFLEPYLGPYIPGYMEHRVVLSLCGDLLLLLSLVVLGGEFWDKLRALFLYDARVVFQDAEKKGSGALS